MKKKKTLHSMVASGEAALRHFVETTL